METMTEPKLTEKLEFYRQHINQIMLSHIENLAIPKPLQQAILYTINNGGKRLRPCLVYLSGELFGATSHQCDAAAMAVEYIHTYSLIHDDLPAMDDDDLRRGKPSCHIAFDEAKAILAGDALQSLAYEVLSCSNPYLTPEQQITLIRTLSQAAGSTGMVAGQALDIDNSSECADLSQLQVTHLLKTGALIQASILLGAHSAGTQQQTAIQQLCKFGHHFGLAFQIQDDILDATQSTESLGKPSNSDQDNNKATYISLLGLNNAKEQRDHHTQLATEALNNLKNAGNPLIGLLQMLVQAN